jgi:hypothetical protein
MKRYIIEREMPGIGTAQREQFRDAAQKSNSVLAQLAPDSCQCRHRGQARDRSDHRQRLTLRLRVARRRDHLRQHSDAANGQVRR